MNCFYQASFVKVSQGLLSSKLNISLRNIHKPTLSQSEKPRPADFHHATVMKKEGQTGIFPFHMLTAFLISRANKSLTAPTYFSLRKFSIQI